MRLPGHVRLALRGLAVAAACAFGQAGAAEPPGNHEVRDPHYGDVLFHFYQDHYFSAVTTLMVSQHFDRVGHHADEAEVLRGGLLLSYGLQREAGAIFARLINRGAEPAVGDRAWYYLAKIGYQRGLPAQAEAALAHVGNALPAPLQDDRALLQAQLLMARADYAGAAYVLERIDAKAPGARYAHYNLGVALIKAGDAQRGRAVLDAIGRAPAESEEYRSLRDRANVALGYAALADHQPGPARGYLERVRLQGAQANSALLGFGWAAADLDEPKLALVPWLELAQRDLGDAAALEAQIAVPYAYATLGAHGQAIERYQFAIASFGREHGALDESIAAIRSGAFLDALLELNPGAEMGWFWRLHALPALPHPTHLAPVLATHEFQEAFKNYRDLRFLADNLTEWQGKLGVYRDMLDTRRRAYAERLPQVRARAGASGLDGLRARRDALATEVARAEADADGIAYADAPQLELLARIERVRNAATGSDPEMDRARERLRLAAGALTWELAQHRPERGWKAHQDLQQIDGQLAEARRRDAALAQAERDEPARFDAYARRIAVIDPLLLRLIPRVVALAQEQRRGLEDIAITALARQQERLAGYTVQARYAVAQLYDRAHAGADAKTLTSEAARAAPRP
jgi:hypothetical protein